jgi:hypothetical protein
VDGRFDVCAVAVARVRVRAVVALHLRVPPFREHGSVVDAVDDALELVPDPAFGVAQPRVAVDVAGVGGVEEKEVFVYV